MQVRGRNAYNSPPNQPPADGATMINWLSSLWSRLRGSLRGGADEMVDAEVREIFLAELDEISATLAALLPAWREQRKHAATLQEIRRGFHTLKGSARMVGAGDLAAFCGRIEQLSLDLIERPAAAAANAVASIEKAIEVLPACARAMRMRGPLPALLRG
jgi:chemosensory pili system protein ChpA (sensor histidine kinase/response regulator)